MIDRDPQTEYPHQTAARLIITPVIIIAIIIMTIIIMATIQNALPKKKNLRFSRYARRQRS
jgi:hypothetical protein